MAIIGIFTLDSVKRYSADNPYLWIMAMVIMFVSLITLACCEGVRRKTPHNFIFLGLFTLAEGFMLGTVTARYRADEVLMAVGVCAAIVLALTISIEVGQPREERPRLELGVCPGGGGGWCVCVCVCV